MAVEHITIRGKKYPFKVGYFVMKVVKQESNADSLKEAFEKAKENEELEIFESVLYAALKQGAWDEEEELDLERKDMELALGSCFVEFMEKFSSGTFFPKELSDATDKLKDLEGEEGEEGEKKMTRNSKT